MKNFKEYLDEALNESKFKVDKSDVMDVQITVKRMGKKDIPYSDAEKIMVNIYKKVGRRPKNGMTVKEHSTMFGKELKKQVRDYFKK